ncbi:DUF63 family protein [Halobacteria archaeon AArc-dxtr1]|nr:DUF63 family protein [Halobacteria archaeon AArc-dxtr1]
MDDLFERVGPERLWVATASILAVGIALAAVLFPQRVYVDIIWHYFWGPVVADAHGWSCVAWADGAQIDAGTNCTNAGPGDGPTATPGYTWQSYAGYIPTLLLLVTGIILLIRRLDIDRYRAGFYGLFPFFLFGGALRVVEDANVAVYRETGDLAIELPLSGFLISPLIYVTVFLIALPALLVSIWLDRNDYVRGYEYPLAGIGTVLLVLTVGLLAWMTTDVGHGWFPLIGVVTLVGATVIAFGAYWLIDQIAPSINRGTQYMGIVVIWAHSVDGIANLIGLSYATDFGWPQNMAGKHPINIAIVDFFGNAWPFLALKIAAAIFVVWIFNEEVFEETPRYAYLLMVTVVAVGLGPGTRDMLRAVFGV